MDSVAMQMLGEVGSSCLTQVVTLIFPLIVQSLVSVRLQDNLESLGISLIRTSGAWLLALSRFWTILYSTFDHGYSLTEAFGGLRTMNEVKQSKVEAIYFTLLNCIHAEEFTIHVDLKHRHSETSGP